ncbi:MAG: delta-60 repeat domain-containing protein, partial [Acidimicrobiaceae bacterium]|nr:delta-60 repeat domain-containing protein [Acidimicrobiaceae bacterium]
MCIVAMVAGVLAPVLPAYAQAPPPPPNPPTQDPDPELPNIDGALDATFVGNNETVGNNENLNDGRFVTKFTIDGEVVNSRANAVALQDIEDSEDKKIVVVGTADDAWALARYNPDGTLDTTFGTGGKVITEFDRGVRVNG